MRSLLVLCKSETMEKTFVCIFVLLFSCRGGEKLFILSIFFLKKKENSQQFFQCFEEFFRGYEWDDPRNDGEDGGWDCALTPGSHLADKWADEKCCQAGKWLVQTTSNANAQMCEFCEWSVADTFHSCNGETFLRCCVNELKRKNDILLS